MNKQTVRFAAWVSRVTYSQMYSYSYDAKKTGQRISSHKFECRIVGKTEEDYVQAVLKGTEKEVENAKKTYVDGSVWELANVKFEENTTPAVISTPLKFSVDLKKSTVKPNKDADLAKQLVQSPVPPRTCAETSQITTTRHQDLLALVTKVEAPRQTKRGEVVDVTVMDGSENAPGSFAQVKIAVWGKEKQALVSLNLGKPLVFLNLACKVGEGSKQYTSWEDSLVHQAPGCRKVTQLNEDAERLQAAKNVAMLTNYTTKAAVDVSGPQALAAGALLAYTAHNASAKLPNVHQLMAVMIEEPTGPVTADGTDRIWFLTKLRDFSGAVDVSVSERVALKLTGLDRAAFKEAHADGSLQFPLLCNTRVSRTMSTGASGQTGASQPGVFVNHILQEAEPLDWNSTVCPNAAYENVLTMLNALPRNEDGLLFGFLADIEPDPYAAFRLAFANGTISKGAAVAVLVASHKKNKTPEPVGEGFKVCAPEVSDIANPSDGMEPKHALTGFATLNDMAKFELTPPRGHQQRFAIALITSCEQPANDSAAQPVGKSFGMEKMQLLEPAEGAKAIPVFQRLRRLTMRLNPTNEDEPKPTLNIDEDESRPFKKARTLSAMPTDESLKETEI